LIAWPARRPRSQLPVPSRNKAAGYGRHSLRSISTIPHATSGELHLVIWGSFTLGFLCGLVSVPRFALLCLITVTGRVGTGYGEDHYARLYRIGTIGGFPSD
jgi:hypothetical protein